MKVLKFASITALTVLAAAAQAQGIRISVPDDVVLPVSTLTRAEVIADYHLWRLAGLQALNQGDRGPDTESVQYRQAQAKYQILRASAQYPTLVAEISRNPSATVLAGSPGTLVSAR